MVEIFFSIQRSWIFNFNLFISSNSIYSCDWQHSFHKRCAHWQTNYLFLKAMLFLFVPLRYYVTPQRSIQNWSSMLRDNVVAFKPSRKPTHCQEWLTKIFILHRTLKPNYQQKIISNDFIFQRHGFIEKQNNNISNKLKNNS